MSKTARCTLSLIRDGAHVALDAVMPVAPWRAWARGNKRRNEGSGPLQSKTRELAYTRNTTSPLLPDHSEKNKKWSNTGVRAQSYVDQDRSRIGLVSVSKKPRRAPLRGSSRPRQSARGRAAEPTGATGSEGTRVNTTEPIETGAMNEPALVSALTRPVSAADAHARKKSRTAAAGITPAQLYDDGGQPRRQFVCTKWCRTV